MRSSILFIALFVAWATLPGCSNAPQAVDPLEYQGILKKLHALECEHLVNAGKPTRYKDAYEFRSAAFQEILRDLNRNVLAEYETYFQQLADLEFRMSEREKEAYFNTTEELYKSGCGQ